MNLSQPQTDVKLPKDVQEAIERARQRIPVYENEVIALRRYRNAIKKETEALLKQKEETEQFIVKLSEEKEKAENDFEEIQQRNVRVIGETQRLEEKNKTILTETVENAKQTRERLLKAERVLDRATEEQAAINVARLEMAMEKEKLNKFLNELNTILKSYDTT